MPSAVTSALPLCLVTTEVFCFSVAATPRRCSITLDIDVKTGRITNWVVPSDERVQEFIGEEQ